MGKHQTFRFIFKSKHGQVKQSKHGRSKKSFKRCRISRVITYTCAGLVWSSAAIFIVVVRHIYVSILPLLGAVTQNGTRPAEPVSFFMLANYLQPPVKPDCSINMYHHQPPATGLLGLPRSRTLHAREW